MRVVRYLLSIAGAAAIAAAVALFLYVRPVAVVVAAPEAEVPVRVFGLGTVEARVLSKVGFEVGGALVELHADHGDRVRQGDLLARLHSGEQEARVVKAQAGVVMAEAAVKKAETAAGKARAVLAQKQQTNRRRQALVAKRTISVEAAEEAQTEEAVAAAELAVAESDVAVATAALADARAQHEYERTILDHHDLKAPFDALVVERHQELGTVVNPGQAIFTLVDPATVWALAHVDESLAGGIRVGQTAEVRLRSLPGTAFQGRVVRVAIESDRVTEERRVYVGCDACPESFHLGEQVEVFITTSVLTNALLVPETAVEDFDGAQGTVWTVEEGRLQRRMVRFGQRTLDARLEVVDGLPPQAEVVTGLVPGLREGRAVDVVGAP